MPLIPNALCSKPHTPKTNPLNQKFLNPTSQTPKYYSFKSYYS